ncbi:hypothetical protein CDD81_3165 [Ophiocordyceps australis]|uniref:Uncharacterized protein n=1 Tax=Ophiocordyceps australis TaxID=1399860 RepID=A0A2C5XQB9_9HYPO|nr:hypothetical protein CDD81_3165 [Ophiocordyceps australis]
MASFLTNLFNSIFVPGPTPTLLRAANTTFAALQLVLAVLLVVTRSVHFIILSVLCAALWRAINWFAAELAAADADAAAAAPSSSSSAAPAAASSSSRYSDSASEGQHLHRVHHQHSSDSDTEVERGAHVSGPAAVRRRAAAALPTQGSDAALSQSSASTEDEWEKVSTGDRDKLK